MIIDWFKNKLGVPENWDKHDYDMARYSFNDMVDFAEQYHTEQLSIQREQLIAFYEKICNITITREYAENIVDRYLKSN